MDRIAVSHMRRAMWQVSLTTPTIKSCNLRSLHGDVGGFLTGGAGPQVDVQYDSAAQQIAGPADDGRGGGR